MRDIDIGYSPDVGLTIREIWRIGQYYSSQQGANTSLVLTADRLYAAPFVVAKNITIDRIAIDVATGAGSNARLGIYKNEGNLVPGELLLDAGEVDTSGTAIVAATIDQVLTKGIYWLAVVADNTPTLDAANYLTIPFPELGIVTTLFSGTYTGWYVAHNYGALPATFGTGTLNGNHQPIVGVRVSTIG